MFGDRFPWTIALCLIALLGIAIGSILHGRNRGRSTVDRAQRQRERLGNVVNVVLLVAIGACVVALLNVRAKP